MNKHTPTAIKYPIALRGEAKSLAMKQAQMFGKSSIKKSTALRSIVLTFFDIIVSRES